MSLAPGSPVYYFVLFLIIGNLAALLLGVLIMTTPRRMGALFSGRARWISGRRLTKPLEVSRETDRALLKHPRVLGAIMLTSAALILIKGTLFISEIGTAEGGRLLARLYGGTHLASGAWESLWLSLVSLIMLGALLALAVGLLSMFSTKTLKRVSQIANRWISTRRAFKPFAKPHYQLDKLVRERPRLWGGVITVLSTYAVVVLGWIVRAV